LALLRQQVVGLQEGYQDQIHAVAGILVGLDDGRGTLLVAYAGWRGWVPGAWKIPTERSAAILPKLQAVAELFGPPCAIMRDLGRAMKDAAQSLVEQYSLSIPILACHQHFLRDIGKDLLETDHDRLRALFRQAELCNKLRTVSTVCGSLQELPQSFAQLDRQKQTTLPVGPKPAEAANPESASLSQADRCYVRTEEMTDRILVAARKSWKKKVA
jgi:hypothetical protein